MTKLDADIDALFELPLNDFIAARKSLAARLKKEGSADDAERVKLLAKPSISAWTANQLYWQHRNEFDKLLATGQRFRKAQTSGKIADMRDALDARREALSELSDLATELLSDAGHNPSMETIRRVATTLEAMSSYASASDGPIPGRLTQDVDPPGFESFAGFVPGAKSAPGISKNTEREASATGRATAAKKNAANEARRIEQTRQAKIGVAKVALQNAKKALTVARTKAQSLEAEKKKTEARAKQAEKHRREAEAFYKKATATSEEAARHAEAAKVELRQATSALEEAERTVEEATKELESLFRQKP